MLNIPRHFCVPTCNISVQFLFGFPHICICIYFTGCFDLGLLHYFVAAVALLVVHIFRETKRKMNSKNKNECMSKCSELKSVHNRK